MLTLFLFGLLLPFALQRVNPSSAASVEVTECSGEYYGFIATVMTKDTRQEYFKDFFGNYCQLNDILLLHDQLDQVRDSFKAAAQSCQPTGEYQADYHKLLMEMYFVRHLQDFSNLEDADIANLEENTKRTLEFLFSKMEAVFVVEESRVTRGRLQTYFDEWSLKYADKVSQYARCSEGPIGELEAVVNDFTETIDGLSVEVERGDTRSLSERLTPEVRTDTDFRDLETFLNSWDYLQKDEALIEEQNQEPDATVRDILSQSNALSFQQALDALDDNEVYGVLEDERDIRQARYRQLYGQNGAQVTTNLQGILSLLNQTIVDSNNKDLPNISSMAKQVEALQCR